MNSELVRLFKKIANATGFEVSGDYIPLPPGMNKHLFVNCTCPKEYLERPPKSILEKCRKDSYKALALASSYCYSLNFESLCLSIFYIPHPGENIRIYRTRITFNDLIRSSYSDLAQLVAGEESQLASLRLLLDDKSN